MKQAKAVITPGGLKVRKSLLPVCLGYLGQPSSVGGSRFHRASNTTSRCAERVEMLSASLIESNLHLFTL